MQEDKASAEPIKCWRVKRSQKQKSSIIVCEGETAYAPGDPSVGIFGGEVTVRKVFGGKHGASVEVQDKEGKPYEEELRMFMFAEEIREERINDLRMNVDAERCGGEESLQNLRDEFNQKYGENLKVGQRVIELHGDNRGKIVGIARDVKVKVKWDKQKTPDVKRPVDIMDEKEWDEYNRKFEEYESTHDIMLEAKESRPFRGPFD